MDFLHKLFQFYSISENEYLDFIKPVTLNDLCSYKSFKNISLVSDRITQAIKKGEKILIYGDYDADGILATSILSICFKKLNYSNFVTYIPSRYVDGYGINSDKVKFYKQNGVSLIITVDNGVTRDEAIKTAHDLNVDIIITDHHTYDRPPNTPYFLHPNESDLTVTTCGAVVSFYLCYALLKYVDDYCLVLASLAICSDVMPLIDNNRVIVRLALDYLNSHPHFSSLDLLSHAKEYNMDTYGLIINPKINAIGRIEENDEINVLVEFFTTSNFHRQYDIAKYIENINEKRKSLTKEIVSTLVDLTDKPANAYRLNIQSGLTGLIANNLLYKFNKPVLVISREEKGSYRVSIRSKKGFNVMEFIHENENLFVEFGGHELAAGASISKSNIDRLINSFYLFASSHKFIAEKEGIEINLFDINFDNYFILQSFAPFGERWKEPLFIIKNIPTNLVTTMGSNNNHLSIPISRDSKIIGFNFPFSSIKNKYCFNITGKFKLNDFRGKNTLNFQVENIIE